MPTADPDAPIPHAGMYAQDNHTEIIAQLSPGDIAYLSHRSDYGTQDHHLRVDTVNEAGVAFENDITLHTDGDEITVEVRGRTEDYDGRDYDLYRIERYPEPIVDDLSKWEVHLCYNLVEECSDDECHMVYARDQEEAIALAERRSDTSPPKVGPVYELDEVTA